MVLLFFRGPRVQDEALDLQHVPEYLIVPEGGYIGLEPGQSMRSLGAATRKGNCSDSSLEDCHEVLHVSVACSNIAACSNIVSSIRRCSTKGNRGSHD